MSAVAYNGNLYILGGQAGSSTGSCTATNNYYCNDVQYDTFNSNGSLGGTWTDDTSLSTGAFTGSRASFGTVAYNGYLYIMGGQYSGSITYSSAGSGNWTAPAGVTSVQVQAWGGGGGGGACGTLKCSDYGGGGGEYAAETSVAVTPGNSYSYTVGALGSANSNSNGNPGTASTFTGNTLTVTAHGGSGGTSLSGAGGTGSSNSVHYNGGSGGAGYGGCPGALGGGGGGSGGSSSIGNNGTALTVPCTTGVAGGVAVTGGGPGGSSTNAPLSGPGGGGGGAGDSSSGGNGWAGQITITWTADDNDVQYAAINSNGSLSEPSNCPALASGNTIWCESTALPTARQGLNAATYDGYLYIMGGQASATGGDCTTSTFLCNGVYYAPINNNGGIGNWTQSTNFTSSSMPARDYFGTVAYNGYVYLMGGQTDTSSGDCTATSDYCNGVFVTGLQSIPRVGLYSRLIDITGSSSNDPNPVGILTDGGDCTSGVCTSNLSNPGLGGLSGPGGIIINYKFASNACTTFNTPTTLPTGLSLFSNYFPLVFNTDGCSNATNVGRYMWVSYQLDDSQTATFPDSSGNHTSIADFTVYIHSASSNRLRGGATFSNGSMQSLDAIP